MPLALEDHRENFHGWVYRARPEVRYKKMKSYPPMFVENAAGGHDMSPAGILVLAAHTFYRLKDENTPARVESAQETMQATLAAARGAGYARIAQLSSALVRGDSTPRLTKMANEACAKVPEANMREIVARADFC